MSWVSSIPFRLFAISDSLIASVRPVGSRSPSGFLTMVARPVGVHSEQSRRYSACGSLLRRNPWSFRSVRTKLTLRFVAPSPVF